MSSAFNLGINYWPASTAMYWWRRFDAEEFVRDCEKIRAAGFRTMRIFLLWEDFQPTPDWLSSTKIKKLIKVADVAGQSGLSLIVTLFTGHMSGVNWLPPWTLELGQESPPTRFPIVADERIRKVAPRNWYLDEQILEAQSFFAREIAGALSGHSAVAAWDLGNENSNCVIPAFRAAGLNWLQRIADEIKTVSPSNKITVGLHMEDLEEDRCIGPAEAATVCDFLSMHGYPIYCDWADGSTDALLLPFLGLITSWLGRRPVLFEEFGAPTLSDAIAEKRINKVPTILGESEAANYTLEALTLLQEYGMLGGILWCYADYAESLWHAPPLDRAEHERYFGLWRADGSPKPAVTEIRNVPEIRNRQKPVSLDWIDIQREEFYLQPKENLRRLYQRFKAARLKAQQPNTAVKRLSGQTQQADAVVG